MRVWSRRIWLPWGSGIESAVVEQASRAARLTRRTLTPRSHSLAEAMGRRIWNAERTEALLDEHPDEYRTSTR